MNLRWRQSLYYCMKSLFRSEAGPSRLNTHTWEIHWFFELCSCNACFFLGIDLIHQSLSGSLLAWLRFESLRLIARRRLAIGWSDSHHLVDIAHQQFDVVVKILRRILRLDCGLIDIDIKVVLENGLIRNLSNHRVDIGKHNSVACKPLCGRMWWTLWFLTECGKSFSVSGI